MQLPESLPARLFLLAIDPTRRRLTGQSHLGYLLRAGALTDLELRGLITDESGKVRVGTQLRIGDPVLDAMLAEIAGDRPRRWRAWVQRRHRAIRAEVREQLEGQRWIVSEPRRILGIFPVLDITVLDQLAVERLRHRLTAVLEGGGRADKRDAALVALVAAGQLRSVVSGRQRRAHRGRIAELSAQAGPAAPALRKVIQQHHAATQGG
jgi:hypothetical protein